MSKLLIINRDQFGYHTDIYKWCEYAKDKFQITELSLFQGKSIFFIDGVTSISVYAFGPRIIRGIIFILRVLLTVAVFRGTIVMCYFPGCAIIKKCMPWKKMILDIRTLSVNPDDDKRKTEDQNIINACYLFDFVSVISDGLRQKIGIGFDKSAILPLGADAVSMIDKDFSAIRLLYVGTLDFRNIDKTIKGLSLFLSNNRNVVDIHYDIVGEGLHGEKAVLADLIHELKLEEYVTLHGYIQHEQLKTFYDNCNIGVSFVPMKDYYEYQPVTKTFEYALSGLYTIATATYSNKEVIYADNGILIQDTPESFAEALAQIVSKVYLPESKIIRNTMTDYLWNNVINRYFIPIIENA